MLPSNLSKIEAYNLLNINSRLFKVKTKLADHVESIGSGANSKEFREIGLSFNSFGGYF